MESIKLDKSKLEKVRKAMRRKFLLQNGLYNKYINKVIPDKRNKKPKHKVDYTKDI